MTGSKRFDTGAVTIFKNSNNEVIPSLVHKQHVSRVIADRFQHIIYVL